MRKVLVVEDDYDIMDLLEIHLKDLDCEVTKTYDGHEGLQKALADKFNLIILDLMLPGIDGMEICRTVRQHKINTPIMMLTAKSEEIDKVLGLEFGADDYMVKPFSIREFIARVKAMFRRTKLIEESIQSNNTSIIKYSDLMIDIDKRKVIVENSKVELSPKEFELLQLLASNPGKSYSRSKLLSLIWGYDFEGYEHTVNSHINRLRAKIEPDMAKPTYVLTAWGVGYKFNDEL